MTSFARHRIATVIALIAFNGMVFAQEPVDEALFDEAPPAIADNLPPDPNAAAAELSESESIGVLKPLPEEAVRQPTIQEEMRPFNSRRIDLVEALVQDPKEVVFNGQTYRLKNPERVRVFYENEQYPTIWTQENKLLDNFEPLKRLIADAPQDALPPARYHDAIINSLQKDTEYNDIIAAELLLSDAYLTLAGDLANGLVNPRKTHPEWNAEQVSDEALGEMLAKGIVSGDIETAVRTINDGNPRYLALKSRYNALNGNQSAEAAPVSANGAPLPKITLKQGMSHEGVAILRDKLGTPATDGDANYFDGALSEAVIAYQKSHGLKADGIVSGKTRNALNGTPQSSGGNASVDRLMINMERLRWLPQDMGNTYVLVNIPSYYVKMFRDGQEVYVSKAVVGQRSRQTPAFTDKLRHIVMSPTWTVPPTIMKKDKIGKLRSNPGAFDGNFEAVVGGRVVQPSAVDWSSPGATSYRLRQKPGPRNALGRVKFLFPNKHAIYLHDTPSKSLFNKNQRALSSGCVRLQKPEEFANILLQNTNWSSERIKKAMSQSKEQWVNTPEQTPIYLVYWTTWSDPDGKIQTAEDIYGKDGVLLQQYKKALNN